MTPEPVTPVSVLLVHGTWPYGRSPRWLRELMIWCRLSRPSPRWFEPGSDFRAELERLLPPPVTISEYPWSGRNTVKARDAAVRDLTPRLRQFAEEHSTSLRVIIAHSHGGNVAYRSAAELPLAERPHGIATMGTPFLVVGRRRSVEWERQSLTALLLLVLVGPAAVISTYGGTWHLPVSGVFGGLAAFALCAVVLWGGLRWWRKFEAMVLGAPSVTAVDGSSLLVIRAPADEASLALGAGRGAGLVAYGLWRLLAIPARISARISANAPKNWAVYFLAPLVLAIVIRVTNLATGRPDLSHSTAWHLFGYGYLLLYLGFPLVLTVIAAAVAAATGLNVVLTFFALAGFGLEFAVTNLGVDVTAEPVPPGEFHGALYMVPPNEIPPEVNGSRHSLHAMGSVRARLADWVSHLRDGRPVPGATAQPRDVPVAPAG